MDGFFVITCFASFLAHRSLFTHWSTPDSWVFDIHDVSPDIMKIIIEFAYTGFVPVTQENAKELFIAADRLNATDIMQACSDFMEGQLATENCISIWCFSKKYYNLKLKHKAFLFILNDFEEVAATSEEFLLLSEQELVKIVEDDRLNVKTEEKVFEAVLRWIAYAPEQRRENISLLLSNVSEG